MGDGLGEGGRELRPVAVVDAVTGEPLMLAYADEEALRLTAETGLAHFYSRSRDTLWLKGASSGSTLEVLEVLLDCDRDAAAYVAYTRRHVCHLGKRSCFHNTVADRRAAVLRRLLEETAPYTRIRDGRVEHPLTTWIPPPSPLLASLAAWLLAEAAREKGRPRAVLAPQGAGGLLGLLVAQRLRARLHLAEECRAPESLGEEDEVLVLAPQAREARCLAEAARRRGAQVSSIYAVTATGDEDLQGLDGVLFRVEEGSGRRPRLRLLLGELGVEYPAGAEDAGGSPGKARVQGG